VRFAAFTLIVATVFFIFGYEFRSQTASPVVDHTNDGPALPPASCSVSIEPSVLRAELARVLGPSVLSLAKPADPPPSPSPAIQPPAEQDPGPAPTPTQVSAFERGRVLVDKVLSQARMSTAESREIRAALVYMDDNSRLETTARLIQAMNQGKLQTESHELPF